MVEYIKREDAINLLWLFADESCASVVSDFESLPAVPVVRCRECENYDENGDCISLDLRIGIHSDRKPAAQAPCFSYGVSGDIAAFH